MKCGVLRLAVCCNLPLTCASISCRLIWVRVMLEKSIVSVHKEQKDVQTLFSQQLVALEPPWTTLWPKRSRLSHPFLQSGTSLTWWRPRRPRWPAWRRGTPSAGSAGWRCPCLLSPAEGTTAAIRTIYRALHTDRIIKRKRASWAHLRGRH